MLLWAVAPFLISQCYNQPITASCYPKAVAPFLISQCYNLMDSMLLAQLAVAPFLISQCYNPQRGNPYFIRIPPLSFV